MRILITGSNGQLGRSIIKYKPKEIEIFSLTKQEFNLINQDQCKMIIEGIRPNWIINCAAYTNVDKAENEYRIAHEVNTLAPSFLTECVDNVNGKLLHISTDYVFNGMQSKPYKPFDKTNPLNNYGLTKAKGEDKLLEFDNNIILRTSWLYSSFGHNFVTTMLKLHNSKGMNNEKINVVYDQISAPTSSNNLAKLCWRVITENIIAQPDMRIIHWHDGGVTSWYDFAISIGEIAKKRGIVDYSAKVVPVKTSEYKVAAARPHYSLLDIGITEKRLNIISNHWRDELEKTIEELL